MKIYKFPLFHHLIIISFVVGWNIIPAQRLEKDRVLASAGNKIITVGEFMKRFEMTPRVDRHETVSKLKEEFLYTLIQEKLWAEYAESQGLNTSPLVKISLREIKKMFARDELYKREVMSKIVIPNSELFAESRRCSFTLYLNYLVAKSRAEIDKLHSELAAGHSFTSILKQREEYKEQQKPIQVECGQVDSAREELFYSLEPGHFTSPVKTEAGWTIFYLKEKAAQKSVERNALLTSAKKIVEKRKYSHTYAAFNKKFLSGKNIKTDDKLFLKLSKYLGGKFKSKSAAAALNFYDIYSLNKNFTPLERKAPFVKFKKTPATIEDFLGFLAFRGIKLKTAGQDNLEKTLIGELHEFIRLEIIYREAVKRGLQDSPEAASALEMWRSNYLAQLSKKDLGNGIKVTSGEIISELNKIKSSGNINSVKVLIASTNELPSIENLLKSRSSSDNLEQAYQNLTDKRNIRLYKSRKFEPAANYLNFGLNENADIGELIGPVEYKSKYYLVEIFDKKKFIKPDSLNPTEKEGVRQALYFRKLRDRIDRKTIELSNKYGVKINYKLLGRIKVSNLSMVLMKYFGLGEKILAVPFVNEYYEWFNKWKNKDKTLP